MKPPQNLALGAIVLFVISHALPAYDNASGFTCFRYCGDILLRREENELGGWLYYSGFAIANFLFIGLAMAQLFTEKCRKLRSILSVICHLQVLSWLFLHIIPEPSHLAGLKIGYYVWLVAYALLVAAHFWKTPIESPAPIPFASSVA